MTCSSPRPRSLPTGEHAVPQLRHTHAHAEAPGDTDRCALEPLARSFRKAGVSLALATGISVPNIINWVLWRAQSEDMCWLYADQKFVVPEGSPWASFFDWMKNRPAQFAHA
jgi:hypothetical protein